RRRAAANEGTTDMAVFAARRALADAGVNAGDLDYVIVATMSADEITPNCAPLVAHALGASRAAAFDIGAACTGFLAGLSQSAALIEVGRAERILLVGSEKLTRITDFDDKKTGMLFGDGAGAVVLGPADSDAGIGPIDLHADGGLGDTIMATHEDPYIRMDGISTFKIAIKRLSEATIRAVASAGLELSDIDLFVYHQANARIIKAVGERLELDSAKVADYIAQLGNTSAASIPLTLSLSREDGRLRAGHKVLVAAIGAGFTWGAGVLEWTGS
ncbi:MAG TPA: beta-ketoacyl-ACP synthase 3, partial [Solirubrobacter sp.]|nr:beta-ketoacyl-ACP synthase 3 [Solirubrobacter sp.]